MAQSEQRLRQPVVVVLGHVDSGKCVSGDTLLQLADGRIAEASRVFETYKTGGAIERPDGVVYEASGLELLSASPSGTVEAKRVTHVWKLHADRLVSVQTRAGYSIRCTPEHKFLVMQRTGELGFVEAGRLSLEDHLALPVRVNVRNRGLDPVKAAVLGRISDDFLIRVSPALNERIEALAKPLRAREKFGDKLFRFHFKKAYYRAGVLREIVSALKISPAEAYDCIEAVKFASQKSRASHKSPWIALPKDHSSFRALAYLVGLLYGDGIAGSGHLANTSNWIIDLFADNLRAAFQVGATKAWRRTCFIVSHKGGKSLGRFLVDAFDYPAHDKTRSLHVPEAIAIMPDDLVASFLRGFFDAEGFVQEGRNIGVGCESKTLMKQLPMLLSRLGCLAYHGKKSHSKEIFISGKDNVSAFVTRVGFGDKEKMLGARIKLATAETNRIFDITPIPGDFIRSLRATNPVIWDDGFQMTYYQNRDSLSRGVVRRLPEAIPAFKGNPLLETMENYATVEVTGLETIEGHCDVYDFTVDEFHNFLANNLIIHNTTLLDSIRGTGVQAREAGGITQEIGASFFPMETLVAICGPVLTKSGGALKIPGLLVIDTPGHEIFSNLRMRGGSAADIAILVVDVNKGLENQTLESIEILRARKVPFLVALNKIDMIKGWRKDTKGLLSLVMKELPPQWNDELEERLYNVVGGLSRLGFESDAFYRVKDFRKQICIVPVSGRSRVGIPELLSVLIGLAQQFLSGKLAVIDETGRARGIVLELQEEVGIGETANIILTDGKISVGDSIVLVKRDGAIESKVKALFMPKPLDEMRDPRDKFTSVRDVYAAAGVKLVTPDLEGVLPGTSVSGFKGEDEFRALKAELEKDLGTLRRHNDSLGVVVKAGSIGGLEAMIKMLEERAIPIRMADIGDISKHEIVEAETVAEKDPYLGAIIGFDVKVLQEAKESAGRAKIITSEVIYDAIEGYVQWAAQKRDEDQRTALQSITPPAKIRAIPGNFFRRNDPAVFGVEVLAGRLKPKSRLMNEKGEEIGLVEQIQENGKSIQEATKGMEVAISVKGPTLGRQVKEGENLYTFPTSSDVKMLKGKYGGTLGEDGLDALQQIIAIRSEKDALYGF